MYHHLDIYWTNQYDLSGHGTCYRMANRHTAYVHVMARAVTRPQRQREPASAALGGVEHASSAPALCEYVTLIIECDALAPDVFICRIWPQQSTQLH